MYRYKGRNVVLWLSLACSDYTPGDLVVADTGEVVGNWDIPDELIPVHRERHEAFLVIIAEERAKYGVRQSCA